MMLQGTYAIFDQFFFPYSFKFIELLTEKKMHDVIS